MAPVVQLNIPARNNLTLLGIYGRPLDHVIKVTGNNLGSQVFITGLLRPFYHYWNQGTGELRLGSGTIDKFYKRLPFTVLASDSQGSTSVVAYITVIEIAPLIVTQRVIPPTIRTGNPYSYTIPIYNNPSKVEVDGLWLGLDHRIVPTGVEIFGTPRQRLFSRYRGNLPLLIRASNSGGTAAPKTWNFNFDNI